MKICCVLRGCDDRLHCGQVDLRKVGIIRILAGQSAWLCGIVWFFHIVTDMFAAMADLSSFFDCLQI
ncbi:hypothetical protein Hanom_Chr03g00193741 [Helianthus anomalus]